MSSGRHKHMFSETLGTSIQEGCSPSTEAGSQQPLCGTSRGACPQGSQGPSPQSPHTLLGLMCWRTKSHSPQHNTPSTKMAPVMDSTHMHWALLEEEGSVIAGQWRGALGCPLEYAPSG